MRFVQLVARNRLPAYRDVGIVNAWVVPVGDDGFASVAIYSSAEGMREGVASLRATGEARGGIYDQITQVRSWLGPMTDIFHVGAHSALQTMEQRSGHVRDRTRSRRHISIASWRIRTDLDAWPDGTRPASIPAGEHYPHFLETVSKLILVRPEEHGMIGGWSIDTGEGTITFLSLYMDAEGMASAWDEVMAGGELGENVRRYLELVERIAGPAIDVFAVGTEELVRREPVS
jgi:hypothetical protein